MMSHEVFSLGTGFAVGLVVSVLFFIGLALGMRKALSTDSPAIWLLVSFLIRSSLLLAVAIYLTRVGEPLITLAGFVLAFFLVRLIAVRWAKAGPNKPNQQEPSCN